MSLNLGQLERYAIGTVALVVAATLTFVAYTVGGGARAGSGAAGVDEVRRQTIERLNGGGLTFVPGAPPTGVIAQGDALAAARRNLHAAPDSEPVLTFGRFTDEFSRNGPPAALVANRPVWVASYPRVMAAVRGSGRGGPRPGTFPAAAYVVIDAVTGDFITTMHDGLEPVVPVPSATWDCSKLTC
jgi:hypothetical protein